MTFQPPSKSLTPRDYQFIAIVIIFFLILSSGLVYANLSLPEGGGDFLVNWVAARGYLFEKIDPYSGQVPARVQEIIYQGPAGSGDNPYILTTPFHLLLFYFPFSVLSDPQLARAIFTLVIELALFSLVVLSLRLTEWEVPRYFWVLFALFGIFNFYTFLAILDATPILLLGLCYIGVLFSLRSGLDELAGALAAISFYHLEMGGPFLFFIFLWMYREGRSSFFAGFAMPTILLSVISFLLYPNWIIPFLRAVTNDFRADYGFSIHRSIAEIFSTPNRLYAWVIIGILVVTLGYEWSSAFASEFRRLYWTCCLTLAATPLLGLRTEMENLAILIIPLALVFSVIYDRWKGRGGFLSILLLILFLAMPWAGYLILLPSLGSKAQSLIFVFLPVFTIISLYWIRWWAINPPRVWGDMVSSQR